VCSVKGKRSAEDEKLIALLREVCDSLFLSAVSPPMLSVRASMAVFMLGALRLIFRTQRPDQLNSDDLLACAVQPEEQGAVLHRRRASVQGNCVSLIAFVVGVV
jgi:hypothetical protein